jgi:hypothetical protein
MLRGGTYQTRDELVSLAARFEQVEKERAERLTDRSTKGGHKRDSYQKSRGDQTGQTDSSSTYKPGHGQRDYHRDQPRNQDAGRNRNSDRARGRDSGRDECNHCGEKGHWARECPQREDAAVRHAATARSPSLSPEPEQQPSGKGNGRKRTRSPV